MIARITTAADSRTPVVVFDLDGTLYDNRARTLRILAEYAREVRQTVPDVSATLEALDLEGVAYLLADTLHGCGVTRIDVVQDVTRYWQDRFFTDDYLRHDALVPGAVDYVRACHQAGATVVYFTGRDVTRMLPGTLAGLRDRGFPVGVAGVELLFNPDATLSDEAYKRVALPSLKRVGHVVALFDNEPANCNIALQRYPDATVARLETQKVPGAPDLAPEAVSIRDFRRA